MDWFKHAFKNIFNYQDRARRAEYGWFTLTNFLIQLAVILVLMVFSMATSLFTLSENTTGIAVILFTILGFIAVIYYIAISLVGLSLTTRRLHDLGWSGWWQIVINLPYLVFLLLGIFIDNTPEGYYDFSFEAKVIIYFYFSSLIVYLLLQAILFFKDGQRFTNKYGEDPKATTHNIVENN